MRTSDGTTEATETKQEIELSAWPVRTDGELTVARFSDRATPGNVGVALSGGGSRAAIAAMGQLRALHALGHLGNVRAISSVSGGTWCACAFTFLPADRSDADFLGPFIADPGELRLRGGSLPGADLSRVAEGNFAHAITKPSFATAGLVAGAGKLRRMGVASAHAWAYLIGDLLYRPLSLFDADDAHRPRAFFAADDSAADRARAANPGAVPDSAHLVRRVRPGEAERPFYICNAAMQVQDSSGPALAPVQITPWFAGIVPSLRATCAEGSPTGGAGLSPFAFGGVLAQAGGANPEEPLTVRQKRVFALWDAVGMSSAFFADFLHDQGVVEQLVPAHGYFQPRATEPGGAINPFADGGSLENTGVGGLLAYRDIDSIIAFVNSSKPIARSEDGLDLVVVDGQLSALFGYQPYREGVGYLPYGEGSPAIPEGATWEPENKPFGKPGEAVGSPDFRFNRMFPEEAFSELLEALWAATTAGGSEPGVGVAAHLQSGLSVLENPWFGVAGGRTVSVLWIYNNPTSSWVDLLRKDVAFGVPRGFPNYPTVKTGCDAVEVNYLAHFSAWVVTQLAEPLRSLFR